MNKRKFLFTSAGAGLSLLTPVCKALDQWGEYLDYPIGWGPAGAQQKWVGYSEFHVGNFSGGIETMLPHHYILPSEQPWPLHEAQRKIKANFFMDASDYAARYHRSGLMIARDSEIWHEQYRFKRTPQMRFFGWSMTKSIVGVLTGIALDQKRLVSLDDRIDQYVQQLKSHDFADITLRNLLNMTSGINICEAFCTPVNGFERYGYSQIGFSPKRGQGTDQRQGILNFKWGRSSAQGEKFNYTDLNPVLMAWVLESVYQMPLHQVAQQYLWQPMGAASKASWLTDSQGFTFSGAGLSATLQDWARFGLMVAHGGYFNGVQIVSKAWLEDTSRHGPQDQAARFNVARPGRGYRNFFWHHTLDGRVLRMAGAQGQNVLIDQKSKTVLVQTGVGEENGADEMMTALFEAACNA